MHIKRLLQASLLTLGLTAAFAAPALGADATRTVRIDVSDKGFSPSKVDAKAGVSLTLVFKRTSDKTCAKRVVFPELKIERDLPLGKEVSVTIKPKKGKPLHFTCGMGMYRSSIVVE